MILCDTIMVEMCHDMFVEAPRMYKTRRKAQCKRELLMIMMCQCRFISCNKCVTLMGEVDGEGSCVCVEGQGVYRTSVVSAQFSY